MTHSYFNIRRSNKVTPVKSLIGYCFAALWFLLTILYFNPAQANEGAILTASDILPDIENALSSKGLPDRATITLANPNLPIGMAGDAANATIANVSYSKASGRFVIRLSNGAQAITGLAQPIGLFLSPIRIIDRGETISADDLVETERTAANLRHFISEASDIIGMVAKRPLRSGELIRRTDIAAPMFAKRGAAVSLLYERDGLRISQQGIALSNGLRGDLISVQNPKSDQVVKGVVIDRNLVSVTPVTLSNYEGSPL